MPFLVPLISSCPRSSKPERFSPSALYVLPWIARQWAGTYVSSITNTSRRVKESNRWVKKAQTIPWLEIEMRYAALFTNRKGNVAKPLCLALCACIIQAEYD